MRDDKNTRKKNWVDIDNLSSLERLIKESDSMVHYALESGKAIPADSIQLISKYKNYDLSNAILEHEDINQLVNIHYKLSRIIEPAKPRTVLLLSVEKSKNSFFEFLGAVPFIRRMVLVAFVFLIGFIGLCLSTHINAENIDKDIFHHHGWELLTVLMFYTTAAGLGGAFAALFEANKYIVKGVFDPKYESSYWIRFILGIMSGLILSSLIPVNVNVVNEVLPGAGGVEQQGVNAFAKPLLAMVGGFSAALLYRILNRMVETIESLISGSPSNKIQMSENVLKSKVQEEKYQTLLSLNSKLIGLQSQINNGTSIEDLKSKISTISKEIMPLGITDDLVIKKGPQKTQTFDTKTPLISEFDPYEVDNSPVERDDDEIPEEEASAVAEPVVNKKKTPKKEKIEIIETQNNSAEYEENFD